LPTCCAPVGDGASLEIGVEAREPGTVDGDFLGMLLMNQDAGFRQPSPRIFRP